MTDPLDRRDTASLFLLWIARVTGLAAIVPLMLVVLGESGSGPAGAGEWVYLALFPFGFSAGYLVGWRWPLFGGCVSLACMAASLVVIQRTFGWKPYLIWGVLSLPGLLFVIAGWRLRSATPPAMA